MGTFPWGGCEILVLAMLGALSIVPSPQVFAVVDATPGRTPASAFQPNERSSVSMETVLDALLFGTDSESGVIGEKAIALSMTRSLADGYNAGSTLDISVTVDAAGTGAAVAALGLVETIPDGWGFESVSSSPQAIVREEGPSGTVEFAWITIPAFPFTLVYRLSVPPGETGTKQITGQLKYRTNGDELTTEILATDIPPFGIPVVGAVKVTIAPYEAVEAGAAWCIDGGDWHASSETVDNLAQGSHVIAFSNIPPQDSGGCFHSKVQYTPPADQQVSIVASQTITVPVTYEKAPKTLIASTTSQEHHGDALIFGVVAATLATTTIARRRRVWLRDGGTSSILHI